MDRPELDDRRADRRRLVLAIVLVLVLMAAALIVSLTRPAHGHRHPAPPNPSPLLSVGSRVDVTVPGGQVYGLTLAADTVINNCFVHGNGNLRDFFRDRPCAFAHRRVAVLPFGGQQVVVTLSEISLKGGRLSPTGTASALYAAVIRARTDPIHTLISEGYAVTSLRPAATQMPPGLTFWAFHAGGRVWVYDAFYADGSGAAQDRQLLALEQSLNTAPAFSSPDPGVVTPYQNQASWPVFAMQACQMWNRAATLPAQSRILVESNAAELAILSGGPEDYYRLGQYFQTATNADAGTTSVKQGNASRVAAARICAANGVTLSS